MPVAVGVVVVVSVFTANRAHEVTMGQAEQRLGRQGQQRAGARPARGVYDYAGSGTEHLTLPPLTQGEGPTIPGR